MRVADIIMANDVATSCIAAEYTSRPTVCQFLFRFSLRTPFAWCLRPPSRAGLGPDESVERFAITGGGAVDDLAR
jgi:hypothetical protein